MEARANSNYWWMFANSPSVGRMFLGTSFTLMIFHSPSQCSSIHRFSPISAVYASLNVNPHNHVASTIIFSVGIIFLLASFNADEYSRQNTQLVTLLRKSTRRNQSGAKKIQSTGDPVFGVLVFLPRSWIILDNLEFLAKILDFFSFVAKILDFLYFFAKILAINLAKKSKIMPMEIREKNHSCFYKYRLSYKYFSSYVKLRLILWLRFLHFTEWTERISWFWSKFTTEAKWNM